MDFKVTDIAAFLNGEIVGDGDVKVSDVSKIEEGKPGMLAFLANQKYEDYIYSTKASAVLVNKSFTPEKEIELFESAIKLAKKETVELEEIAVSMISEADASIFDVHLMFLEDKSLIDSIKKIILRGYSVEYGLKNINSLYQSRFKKMNEEIFREKGADFKDVMLRLLKIARSLRQSKPRKR